MSHPIASHIAIYAALRERLLAAHPDEDAESIADTLDGASDLQDKLVAIFESSEEDAAMCDAIRARMSVLQERYARLEQRSKVKRSLISWAMQEAGVKRIERPFVTLSLRTVPPSVVITDEAAILPAFITTKVTTSPNKAKIKEVLETGFEVSGASLSNGGLSLSARIK